MTSVDNRGRVKSTLDETTVSNTSSLPGIASRKKKTKKRQLKKGF